jgi:hypothetical protein
MSDIEDVSVRTNIGELTDLFAVIADGEGIAGINVAGEWFRLVTHDREQLPVIMEMARTAASRTQRALFLVRFTNAEIVAPVPPASEGPCSGGKSPVTK